MAVIAIAGAITSEQNRVCGLNRTSQRSTKNSIFELRFITSNIIRRLKLMKFVDQFGRQFVVRVQRENPRGGDLVDAKIPLRCVSIELALEHHDVWMRRLRYRHRFISAKAIDHHDLLSPSQRSHCSPNVFALVERQDKRSNRDHRDGRSPAVSILFQRKGKRPAPRNCRLQKPDSRNSADKLRLLQNLICPPSASGFACWSHPLRRAMERFFKYP